MKKILPILLIGIIIASSFGTAAFSTTQTKQQTKTLQLHFTNPTLTDYNQDYQTIQLQKNNLLNMRPGEPMLPKQVHVLELDFGVTNVDIDVRTSQIQQQQITKQIRPAPARIRIDDQNTQVTTVKNNEIYQSKNLYPNNWIEYDINCGLNEKNKRVTFVTIHTYPVRYSPATNTIYYTENLDISITYTKSTPKPTTFEDEYDLVIIAPNKFSSYLQPLVDHKNNHGVATFLATTQDIYAEYDGEDRPEKIKYFLLDAIETYNITNVLLVGGVKSYFIAILRDDPNQGSLCWHVPVRYSNLFEGEPGYLCDLYYADIYKQGGVFDDWDSNDDGIYAAWSRPGAMNDQLDLFPDLNIGRLACRNRFEVQDVVNKIISYESTAADPSWFEKMVSISGDGFLDQEDLDIEWDVNSLPNGEYTIHAQCKNPDDELGPIDTINVTVAHSQPSNVTFNHDDHLKIDGYPFPPIAEIVSPSEGNILGNTNVFYEPTEREAYCNSFSGWANVQYTNGIMHIRGKAYDPRPYGNVTELHVWITNSTDDIVFDYLINETEMYYEGEWTTGSELLMNRGGAIYYMPNDYEKITLWTSEGTFASEEDVIETLSEGCGFAFFSGHGSPRVWCNHYPGIPGNRQNGEIDGLVNLNLFSGPPYLPMNKITNTDKYPVVVVGGCHNSQFNMTFIGTMLDKYNTHHFSTYGYPVFECWSWWLTRLPDKGAIATIGNTGYGYGVLGKECTTGGVDNWITTEFFKQYGQNNQTILGGAHSQSIISYLQEFGKYDITDVKTVQGWVLLGDPTLMIGGYS